MGTTFHFPQSIPDMKLPDTLCIGSNKQMHDVIQRIWDDKKYTEYLLKMAFYVNFQYRRIWFIRPL
jgi:hypothetical protein